ncbi:hypothetical protein HZH68_008140 [Vespula germanica]|nr:hypothetical protein HZH68_008140 [Vespula germanica]
MFIDSGMLKTLNTALDYVERNSTHTSRTMGEIVNRSHVRSSHNFGGDEVDLDEEPPSPTTQSPNAYLAAKYGAGSELARSRSTHALKSREPSPERDRSGAEKDGAALSSWARYLKNKYGNRSTKDKEPPSTTTSIPSSSASATSRRLSLGLPLRHTGQTSFESSDDDQKNPSGSPTSPTAAPVIPAAAGSSTRSNYLLKRRQLFKFGMRGSEAGCFTWPRGLAIGPDNTIVVADSSNHRVQVNNNFQQRCRPTTYEGPYQRTPIICVEA